MLPAIEFHEEEAASYILEACLRNGLSVTRTQGNCIRVFPALNITWEEMEEGLGILEESIQESIDTSLLRT